MSKKIVNEDKTSSKSKKIVIISIVVLLLVIAAVVLALWKTGVIFKAEPYDYDDLSEYVTVGEYKGLTYDKVSVEVSDEEVQTEIQSRLEAAATTDAETTGTVEDGDTINITYEGKIDGKTFDGGSSDSYDLTIGETSMIDGFTDGLIGMAVGDKKELNLKFPDDYENADVAGKDVVFTVTVNTKNVTTTPEYDETFIKDNSEYDNKEDYEASVKEDLLKQKTEDAEANIKDTLWQQILDASDVKKYPEKELNEEIDTFKAQYESYAEQYGVEWDEFLESYMQMTEEEFEEQAKTYSQTVVKSKLVMYSIARKEDVTVKSSEFKDYLSQLLEDAGFTEETFKSSYGASIEDYAKENSFEYYYLLEKVIDKVMSLGTEK